MADSPAPLVGNGQFPRFNLQDTLVDSRNFNKLIDELNSQDPGLIAITRRFGEIESDADFAVDDTWQFAAGNGDFPVIGTDITLPERFEIAAAYVQASVLASAGANDLFLQLVPSWVTLPAEIADTDNHLLASPLTLDELADATTTIDLVAGGSAEMILKLNYVPAGGVDFDMVDSGGLGDVANIAVTGNDTDGWVITATVEDGVTTVGTVIAAVNAAAAARRLVTASWDPASSALATAIDNVAALGNTALSATTSIYRSAVAPAHTRTKQITSTTGVRLIAKVTDASGAITDWSVELVVLCRIRDRANGS